MAPRTRSSYAPLPAALPLVLAPASPLPPSFDSDVQHWSHALADIDKPRRLAGVRHAAPPALGLPQLVSTAVCGRWGNGDDDNHDQAPPWVLAVAPRSKDDRRRDKAERRAWDQLGVAGIPRDEVEADEWELVKRKWRAKGQHDKAHKVKPVEPMPSSADSKKSVPVLSAHFPSSKSSVAASSGSKKRPPSSPPAAHSPSSPPGPRSVDPIDKPVAASSGRPTHSASFASLSSINSAGRGLASPAPRRTSSARALAQDVEDGVLSDGEDAGDEVLYERGCTQVRLLDSLARGPSSSEPWARRSSSLVVEHVSETLRADAASCSQMVLPDPTPSAAVSSARLPRTSTASISSSTAALAAAPFSSPGLRPSAPIPGTGTGLAISTPHALPRPGSAAHLPSPSASPRLAHAHSRSATPPSTIKAPARRTAPPSRATTAASSLSVPLGPAAPPGGAKQAVHRLSSIARTGSALSGRSAAGEGDDGTWEGFLEADAQD